MANSIPDYWYQLADDSELPLQIPEGKETEFVRLAHSKFKPEQNLTMLMVASMLGNEKAVLALIKSGEKVNAKCSKGHTALSYAVSSGHFKSIQTLVANCADINCTGEDGNTPLMLAAKNGFDDIVQYLLAAGARKSKKSYSALCLAALKGNLKSLQTLIIGGINLNMADTKGVTVLMKAAEQGLSEVVECLIDAKANVNLQCKKGRTALSYAASNDRLHCVKILNTSKTDLNLADCDGQTPLMKAAMNGHCHVVDYLATVFKKQDFNTACKDGKPAVFYAAEFGHLECVKIFIDRCEVDINVVDEKGQSLLMTAILRGHLEIVEYLLRLGARCDTVSKDGMTAIHFAASTGNVDFLQNLLVNDKRKIKDIVNVRNSEGQTPIMLAALARHSEMVKYLLKVKVDIVSRCNKSWTVLHYATHGGKFSCIRNIVNANKDINVQTEDGQTSLMIACSKRMHSVAAFLISLNVAVNMQSKEGRTALHFAVESGSIKCIEQLLTANAHVNHRDKNGDSPLILAARLKRRKVIECLIRHGANVNIQNNEGKTALHCACYQGNLTCVMILVEAKTNMELEDKLKNTVIMAALKNEFWHIVSFLSRSGADVTQKNNFIRIFGDGIDVDAEVPPLTPKQKGPTDFCLE